MKRIAPLLGSLLGALCLALFLRTAAAHWETFRTLSLNSNVLFCLALAVASYLLTYLLSSRSWQLALRLLGAPPLAYTQSLQIVVISQIGKYVPGNVGQHLGRIVLARRSGIEASRTAASIAIETILLVGSAGICSLAAFDLLLIVSAMHETSVRHNLTIATTLLFMAALVLLLIPWSRHRLIPFARRCTFLFSRSSLALSSRIILIQIASFGLGAIALWFTVQAMSDHAQVPAFSLLGVYAIAWLVGFIVPGAPAGLGIREALLVFGLTFLYGGEVAATSTVLFRVTTVLGDGIAFVLGLFFRDHQPALPSPPH